MKNIIPLEEMTLTQLKEEAKTLGIDTSPFRTKAPLIAAINAIRAKEISVTVDPFKPQAPGIDNASRDEVKYQTKAERMKDILSKQPKVRFLIPLEPGEKKGSVEVVTINGYRMNILKGEFVELPQQVADMLAENYKLTSEAGSQFDVNRIDPKTGRPVSEQL